jgi:DNA-nicking Smr family endonuclease
MASETGSKHRQDDFLTCGDDFELFRRAVGDVHPLQHDRVVQAGRRAAPIPLQTALDEEQVLRDMMAQDYDQTEIETGEELWFCRPGLQPTLLRKLRRGQFTVQGELDLHGMTVPVARQALGDFLRERRLRGARCVRIIHGKGLGSRHRRPVLKNKVNAWLQRRDEVLAFCSARPVDGGTGAVYVLLRNSS